MLTKVCNELAEMIATLNPEKVSQMHASEELEARFSELLARDKTNDLNAEEKAEMESYMQFEHVMRMAKVRAKMQLAAGSQK